MKHPSIILGALAGIVLLSGCANGEAPGMAGQAQESAHTAPAAMATDTTDPESAVLGLNSPDRKLIHEASLHAEVPDLYPAMSRIEAATLQLGGQVTSSDMRKELRESHTERKGSDSLQEFRRFSGTALLSLRVPVARLDSLLGLIAAQTSFIENRQLRIDDATYRHLENALRNRSLSGAGSVVEGASREDGLEGRQYLDRLRADRVARQVENLKTDDLVAYASLSLELRQPDDVVSRVLPDLDRLMQPGPGQRFIQYFLSGWELLYDLFLALLRIWPLTLLVVLGIIFGRRWYRRLAKPQSVRTGLHP